VYCIYRTQDLIHAQFIVDQLKSIDIPAFIQSNDASGTLMHYRSFTSVEIFINEEDKAKVEEFLSDLVA